CHANSQVVIRLMKPPLFNRRRSNAFDGDLLREAASASRFFLSYLTGFPCMVRVLLGSLCESVQTRSQFLRTRDVTGRGLFPRAPPLSREPLRTPPAPGLQRSSRSISDPRRAANRYISLRN